MSKKKLHALDHAWQMLHAACEEKGRMVTAGELAKQMGVSRNTAFARIHEMLENEAIIANCQYRGSVPNYRYGTAGFKFNKPIDGKKDLGL